MALNFSNTDKAKYKSGQYYKEIRLYFPELSHLYLNKDIYAESMTLEESIFDGNGELSIIGCISNRFSIEVRNQGYQLKNKRVEVEICIDNGSWNRIFTGYVDSVETVRDRSYQKLTCYDALYKYQNKDFYATYSALTFPVTIYNLRNALFSFMGVTQVSQNLPNDFIAIPQTIEDGEISCLDAIRAICQMNGVFGRINAEGYFQYYDLEQPSGTLPYPDTDVYPSESLYPSDGSEGSTDYIDKYKKVSFEDYETAPLTGVTVRDNQSDANVGQYGTTGNMLLIEGNMWCQGLGPVTKETIAENIFTKLEDVVYQPFEAINLGLPWVECGDAVKYYVYDYSSGEPVTDIMGFTVMSRYLKGIQWLEDKYTANGTEYQPEVKPVSVENDTAKEVKNLENAVSTISTELGDKQDKLIAGSGIDITDNVISATGGGGGGGINYSMNEQDTGLTYTYTGMGGVEVTKKVYQITFTEVSVPTDGSYITIDLTSLDPLFIISTDAVLFQNINGQFVFETPCPFYQNADNYCFMRATVQFNDAKSMYVWSKLSFNGSLHMTIRYIKNNEPNN